MHVWIGLNWKYQRNKGLISFIVEEDTETSLEAIKKKVKKGYNDKVAKKLHYSFLQYLSK